MDGGRIVLDAPREEALEWLAEHRPLYLPHAPDVVCAGQRRALLLRRARRARPRVARGPARRDRRARRAERRGQDDSRAGSPRVCSSRRRARRCGSAPRYLAQDPGRHLVTRARARRGRARRRRAARAVGARAGSASRASPSGIHATCPRASASGCRSRRCSRPSRTSSCSTSRPAASTRSARSSWRGCCAPRPRARGTLVVTHDLPWAAEVADRVVDARRAGGHACVGWLSIAAVLMVAALVVNDGALATAARRDRARRRRDRLVRGRHRLDARARRGRHARRGARRRGGCSSRRSRACSR